MIRKNHLSSLLIILICAGTGVFAQAKPEGSFPKNKCSCGFSSMVQVGPVVGGNTQRWMAQSVNGIRYKEWFVGIGGAVDFYRFRTIPVFLDVRRYLTQKITTPFIYVDGGVNLPWLMEREKPSYEKEDFKAGWYFDAGLGYRLSIGGRHGILLSAGYTEKNTSSKRWVAYYCPLTTCPDSERLRYTFKRYVFKLGWQF